MQKIFKLLLFFIIFLSLPFFSKAQEWQWVINPANWKTQFKNLSLGEKGEIYIGFNQLNQDSNILEDIYGNKIKLKDYGILFLNPDGKFIKLAEIKTTVPSPYNPAILNFTLISDKVKDGKLKIIGITNQVLYFDNKLVYVANNSRKAIFIAECDTNGKWNSVKTIGYTNDDFLQAETDIDGNIYLVLHLQNSIEINQNNKFTAKYPEIACAWLGKFTPQGDFLWSKKICQNEQATFYTSINQLAIDKHGNVYHGGSLWKDSTNYGFLLYKYKPDGTLIYKRNIIQGNYYYFTFSNSLQIDSLDNIYLSGNYTGTFYINNNQFNAEGAGIFTIKFDSSLNMLWAVKSQGKGFAGCHSSTIDNSGNIYITGKIDDTTDFAGLKINVPPKDGKKIITPFVAKFSTDGIAEWAYSPFTNGLSTGIQINIDECDNIITNGVFTAPPSTNYQKPNVAIIQFGDYQLGTFYNNNYLAKYSQRQLKIKRTSYCVFDSLNAIADTSYKSFKWQFSNGQIINGKKIIFIADSPGWYKVKLTATTAKGCIQHTEDSFYFVKPSKAYFVLTENKSCQYNYVQFKDSSYADTINAATGENWYWDFGDSTSTYGLANPNKIYSKPGKYSVRLEYNNGFCTNIFSRQIEVLAAPKPGFSINTKQGCTPLKIKISDKSEGEIISYKYDFGNGQTDTIAEPELTYTIPGKYLIKQSLLGPTGCITKDSVYIQVLNGFSISDFFDVYNVTVSSDSSVKFTFKSLTGAKNYNIYRGKTLSDFQYIATTTDSIFEDTKLECNEYSYTYKVIAADKCGNTVNSSNYTKTILLKGENHENKFAVLSWSPYELWNEGVKEYCLETKDSNNAWRELSCNQNLQSEILDYAEEGKNEKCYRIRATENKGNNQQSLSNEICLPYIPTIWIPNAFSPNNDGLNDTFKILTLGITEFKLTIYNRWGEQVFASDNIDNYWTGQDEKTKFPDGEYLYIINAKGVNKENIYKSGSILLMM